ncbi:MAG: AsmA-like C-terminal region-containing protein [Bacteroidota bacterium]
MKKLLIIVGIIFVLIIAAAAILPAVFKDHIKALVDKELEGAVDADIYFDADKFGLSLFSNFPNFTVSLGDFGVIGRDEFADEILFAAQHFEVVVDLGSVIFGSQPNINAIILDNVRANIIVLEDGKANYDITIESEEVPQEEIEPVSDEQPAEFAIGIDSWKISNAEFTYDDRSQKIYTKITGLNHSGSGDFTQDIFDLKTNTIVEDVVLNYEGDQYVSNKSLDIDMTLNMNLPESKYTFKENTVKVNDFAFGFDGNVILGDDYKVDITFNSKENTFKSILSLVPGMFTESFDELETKGTLEFNGAVNGVYSDSLGTLPAFNVNLAIADAEVHYPDLPKSIENIELDMSVDNKDGVVENTAINIKKFHMDLGDNPVDATVVISNLKQYPIDANIKAKIDLADFASSIPMEGLQLKGLFEMNATANGYYDSTKNIIPKIDVFAKLSQGFIKYDEYPIPLNDIHFTSMVKNSTGKLNDTKLNVDDFTVSVDGEKLNANLDAYNLDDPIWDFHVHGGIDLGKIAKILNLEGMTLAGNIKADIDSKGQLSYLEKEQYNKLPTSGTMTVSNFSYVDKEVLPQGFKIQSTNLVFNPSKIDLKEFKGSVGKSDLNLNGFITDYLGFAMMGEDHVLKGNFTFTSSLFDANEWLVEEESAATEETTEESSSEEDAPIEPVEIPRNIDFVLKSSISKVLYDNLTLNNVKGNIIVKDGKLEMKGLGFNTLGGNFTLSGGYDSRDIDHPKFDLDFGIKSLSIPKAYSAFNTIQTAAPIAKLMQGDFSTNFKMSGELLKDMTPDYNTLQGKGLLEVAKAAITGSKVVDGIAQVTSLTGFTSSAANKAESKKLNISDLAMQTEIKEGRVNIKPTDFTMGGYKTQLSGSSGLAGDLDYRMKMSIPAGKAGAAFNDVISKYAGGTNAGSSNIDITLGILGNYDDPKVQLLGTSAKDVAKNAAKDAAKKVIEDEVADKVLDKLDIGGTNKSDSTDTASTKQKVQEETKEVVDKAKDEVKKKLRKLFGN